MRAMIHGVQFIIPDDMVEEYVLQFTPLKKWDNRGNLNELREDILEVLEVAKEDPEALTDPDFVGDFINTLAMRHALYKLCILHDA